MVGAVFSALFLFYCGLVEIFFIIIALFGVLIVLSSVLKFLIKLFERLGGRPENIRP